MHSWPCLDGCWCRCAWLQSVLAQNCKNLREIVQLRSCVVVIALLNQAFTQQFMTQPEVKFHVFGRFKDGEGKIIYYVFFFFNFHNTISYRFNHLKEISPAESLVRLEKSKILILCPIENFLIFSFSFSPVCLENTLLGNYVCISHWFLKIHIAASKTLKIVGHVTNCCKRLKATKVRVLVVTLFDLYSPESSCFPVITSAAYEISHFSWWIYQEKNFISTNIVAIDFPSISQPNICLVEQSQRRMRQQHKEH